VNGTPFKEDKFFTEAEDSMKRRNGKLAFTEAFF
jgi:hypothetical protein